MAHHGGREERRGVHRVRRQHVHPADRQRELAPVDDRVRADLAVPAGQPDIAGTATHVQPGDSVLRTTAASGPPGSAVSCPPTSFGSFLYSPTANQSCRLSLVPLFRISWRRFIMA